MLYYYFVVAVGLRAIRDRPALLLLLLLPPYLLHTKHDNNIMTYYFINTTRAIRY